MVRRLGILIALHVTGAQWLAVVIVGVGSAVVGSFQKVARGSQRCVFSLVDDSSRLDAFARWFCFSDSSLVVSSLDGRMGLLASHKSFATATPEKLNPLSL